MSRSLVLGALCILGITATLSSTVAQTPTKDPAITADPLVFAQSMIARCHAFAAAHDLPPLSVAVVEQSGALAAFARQPGAAPATADAAILKARTSIRLQAETAMLADVVNDPQTRDAFLMLDLTSLAGGTPFAEPEGFSGAVGVSGGNKEQDAQCARVAVARTKDGKD